MKKDEEVKKEIPDLVLPVKKEVTLQNDFKPDSKRIPDDR